MRSPLTPRKSNRAGKIVIPAVAFVDEFPLKESDLQIVDQGRTEDVVVASENALYPNVGKIGVRVRVRDSERTLILDAGIVHVVAGGEEVARTELMVELTDDDVAAQNRIVICRVVVCARDAYPGRLGSGQYFRAARKPGRCD